MIRARWDKCWVNIIFTEFSLEELEEAPWRKYL
jgi:hypothetical protein